MGGGRAILGGVEPSKRREGEGESHPGGGGGSRGILEKEMGGGEASL